jgi:hypothetical protein
MSLLAKTHYHLSTSKRHSTEITLYALQYTILTQLHHPQAAKPKPRQQNAITLHLLPNFLLPLLIHRDTHNKHQTPTLASKRTMPHPGFPVRIGALGPALLQLLVVQVTLSHENLLDVVMDKDVLLVARAGLPSLQRGASACLLVLVEDELVYAWFDGGPGAVVRCGCGMEFELLHCEEWYVDVSNDDLYCCTRTVKYLTDITSSALNPPLLRWSHLLG